MKEEVRIAIDAAKGYCIVLRACLCVLAVILDEAADNEFNPYSEIH